MIFVSFLISFTFCQSNLCTQFKKLNTEGPHDQGFPLATLSCVFLEVNYIKIYIAGTISQCKAYLNIKIVKKFKKC